MTSPNLLSILGVNLLFMAAALPSFLLLFTPLQTYISDVQRKLQYVLIGVLLVYEYGVLTGFMVKGILPVSYTSYYQAALLQWIPFLLLSFSFYWRKWSMVLFIGLLHFLFLGAMESLIRNVLLLFMSLEELAGFYPIGFLIYGLLGLFLYKPMYAYYTEIFQAYEQLGSYQFWRIANLYPLFLVLDMLYVLLRGDRVLRVMLFRPRLLLFVGLLLFMAAIRSSFRQMLLEVVEREKKDNLENQIISASDYLRLAQTSKERIENILWKRRTLYVRLQDLFRQKKGDKILQLLAQMDEQLDRTTLARFCDNALINATLTAYVSRARKQDIPVTVHVDIPEKMPFTEDFAMVLSNLIENAIHASVKEMPSDRQISILVLRQDTVLNLLVRNQFSGSVEFNTEGLPVTHEPGHGLGMRSLARFRDQYDASVLCRVKNGQFSTYLQVDTAVRT